MPDVLGLLATGTINGGVQSLDFRIPLVVLLLTSSRKGLLHTLKTFAPICLVSARD